MHSNSVVAITALGVALTSRPHVPPTVFHVQHSLPYYTYVQSNLLYMYMCMCTSLYLCVCCRRHLILCVEKQLIGDHLKEILDKGTCTVCIEKKRVRRVE